ncbi:DUF1534 domain-containing protein [Pseudomonas congelans]|nr:DUF1534 domain-containing protein [Pseudomonas congelans]
MIRPPILAIVPIHAECGHDRRSTEWLARSFLTLPRGNAVRDALRHPTACSFHPQ